MRFLLISLLNLIREIPVTYMIYFGQEPTVPAENGQAVSAYSYSAPTNTPLL